MGKTRLARELARLHAASYADGAWLVELAELTEPSRVADAVASVVGFPAAQPGDRVEALKEYLRHKQMLLVFDNCEHLVGACAELLSSLLRTCPRLHILATSREPLAITGEIIWLLRPLQLPDPNVRLSTDQLHELAAVKLFVERARAVNPSVDLTDDSAAAIARVCVAVDGIPLAIELAAARTRVVTVEQLSDILEHDVHVLGGASRGGAARHRTIRATIDWSHDLLGEREQILLRRLSVLAGGWTLETAEEVCAGPRYRPRRGAGAARPVGRQVDGARRHTRSRGALPTPRRRSASMHWSAWRQQAKPPSTRRGMPRSSTAARRRSASGAAGGDTPR